MTFININDIKAKEIVPGFWGRFVHSENVTLASWQVEPGASLPQHSHPHEQVTTLIEGEFELTIAGETRLLKPGMVAVVPPNVQHSARALTACQIIDVFYPVRSEYQN